MLVKAVLLEDFNDYKKPSMFIAFPSCSFKCEIECGDRVCQNGTLVSSPNKNVSIDELVKKYTENNLTQAVVCAGLEPFDSWKDLLLLVNAFRLQTDDDIVIYTGYQKCEIINKINALKTYPNIVIKYGRFIPDQEKKFDEVLGVYLASPNQYAERIS